MEKQTRGPIGTHSESTQRCPLLESLLCKHALGTDSAVPLGSEKVERHLIIFHESGYIFVLQNGFLSNLMKTWTYAVRTHKKGFHPPNNFFMLIFFPLFQPMKKLFGPCECLLLFIEQATMLRNNLALLYFF